MKRQALFAAIFAFLCAMGAWGQFTYTWTGAEDYYWNNLNNWMSSNGGTQYPGYNVGDTAILIGGDSGVPPGVPPITHIINVNAPINDLYEIRIQSGCRIQLNIGYNITIETLEIFGVLHLPTTNAGVLDTFNLTIDERTTGQFPGFSAGFDQAAAIPGSIRMRGATVTMTRPTAPTGNTGHISIYVPAGETVVIGDINLSDKGTAFTGGGTLIVGSIYPDPNIPGSGTPTPGDPGNDNDNVIELDNVFLWTGSSNTNWDDADNWVPSIIPQADDNVAIPATVTSGRFPVLDIDVTCLTLINEGEINFGVHSLTVTDTLTNAGTINLNGNNLTVNGTLDHSGTMTGSGNLIVGTSGNTGTATINSDISVGSVIIYGDAAINASVTITTTGDQTYNGNITFSTHTLTLGSTAGSVEVTEAITGSYIIVNAAAGITLNGANEIDDAVLTNTNSGNISFINTSASLDISAINNYTSGEININQTGIMNITSPGLEASLINLTIVSGYITQAGIITAQTLTVNVSGDITLDQSNVVPTVNLTSTGAISYTSDISSSDNLTITASAEGNISITEITGNIVIPATINPAISTTMQQAAVDITADNGNIIVNGNINSTSNQNGVIRLLAGAGNSSTANEININGEIFCYRLAMIAGNGGNEHSIVNINGPVNTVRITALSSNATAHNENAAVYIRAGNISGDGGINLPGNGWACAWILYNINYNGTVTGQGIHFHTGDRHVVYRPGARNTFNPVGYGISAPFLYMQADSNLGNNLSIHTSGTGNIYIINIIANLSYAAGRNITLSTEDGGFIEFIGSYVSTGTLTIEMVTTPSNDNSVRLNGAVIELTGTNAEFNTNGRQLMLVEPPSALPPPPSFLSNSINASSITLSGGIYATETHNLTLSATNGISITGDVGESSYPLGNFIVNNPLQLTGNVSIYAENINFGGDITSDADFTLNLSGYMDTTASITITASTFTVASGSNIQPSYNLTIAGDTVNNGTITVNSTSGSFIDFAGNYEGTGSLIGASTVAIRFGSNVTLNNLTHNDSLIVFYPLSGTNETSTLTTSSQLGDVLIERGKTLTLLTTSDVIQADDSTLTLEPGDSTLAGAVLDVGAGSWFIGESGSPVNGFAGINGTLIFGGPGDIAIGTNPSGTDDNSRIKTANLNLTSSNFNIENDGWAIFNVSGDVDVNFVNVNVDDLARLVIEMAGSGSQSITAAGNNNPIGSLHVLENSNTTIAQGLNIHGEMYIEFPGTLVAAEHDITMRAGILDSTSNRRVGRWIIDGAPSPIDNGNYIPVMRGFLQNSGGSVSFERYAALVPFYFEILGNTVWQTFICEAPGAVIQFSRYPHHHLFLEGFKVEGGVGDHVILTRYVGDRQENTESWLYLYALNPINLGDTGWSTVYGLPNVPPPGDLKTSVEREKFWNFNIASGQGQRMIEINNVTISFSHAWVQRIPVPQAEDINIEVFPFFRSGSPNVGFFNYDWIRVREIIYSFIEDGDGNGKADRIRVQTTLGLNGNFSDFGVYVEGFRVRSYDSFELVHTVLDRMPAGNPVEEDRASFFIFLEEGEYLYDGRPVRWRITHNNSLKDALTLTIIGEAETGEIFSTINTIPPRIMYAITLPGHNQTFVRMSQPVSAINVNTQNLFNPGGGTIAGYRIPSPVNHESFARDRSPPGSVILEYLPYDLQQPHRQFIIPLPSGVLSYLVQLDSAPSVADLAGLPPIGDVIPPQEWFSMQGLVNLSVRALDWRDPELDPESYMFFPPPRYPANWNFTEYRSFRGNSHVDDLSPDYSGNPNPDTEIFLPPFQILTGDMTRRLERFAAGENVSLVTPACFTDHTYNPRRRSTDILVSRRLTSTDSENYFAWPVWARHTGTSDDGIIWIFDGTDFLQDRDITLQAKVNNGRLNGFTGLSLFYGFNVPVEYRNPPQAAVRGRGTGGLWLPQPSVSVNPFHNLVPFNFPSTHLSPNLTSGPLFNFDLSRNDGAYFSTGGKIEFLLRLEGLPNADPNLFIARLDAPTGSIPTEWWTMIRPFGFDIQDIRLQRGGVTILNNVINSDRRETVFIRYHLVRPGRVTVQVFTLDGRLVRSLRRNEHREAGEWTDIWDGTNNGGRPVARGMYFVRVVGPDIDEIRKIMVVR